ncbi:MAG: hypothetical protein WC551_11965 [Patescibacteria group bacterium]
MIKRIVSSAAATTVFELHNPLASCTDATIEVAVEVIAEGWAHVQPRRAQWSTRCESEWVAVADLPEGGWVELTTATGASCRIAEPSAWAYDGDGVPTERGRLRVWAGRGATASFDEDITSYWLTRIGSAAGKIKTVLGESGWQSYICLDNPDPTILWYKVEHCPEVNTAYIGVDPQTKLRTWRSCAYNLRDWTQSLGNAADVPYTAIDAGDGSHWYCAYGLSGADLSAYNAECENWLCPYFSGMTANGGWRLNLSDWRKIWYGKNRYYVQVMAGNPTVIIGRGAGRAPGILWLAGFPRYFAQTSAWTNRETPIDYAILGQLYTATPYDLLDCQSINDYLTGTLAVGAGFQDPTDFLGNEIGDGTDLYQILGALPGVTGPAFTPPDAISATHGYMEQYRQRIRRRHIALRDIDLSDEASGVIVANGTHTLRYTKGEGEAADILEVWLTRDAYTGEKTGHLPALTRSIMAYSITDHVLRLQFSLGVEGACYMLGAETNGYMVYATGGRTVDPIESRKDYNLGATNAGSLIGAAEKLRQGDTIRIVGLPSPHDETRLTCLRAQAFGGDTYPNEYLGDTGIHTIEFTPGGAFYPTDATTFTPQEMNYDYAAGWVSGFNHRALGNFTPPEAPDVYDAYDVDLSGIGSGTGPVQPGIYRIRGAWTLFLLSVISPPPPLYLPDYTLLTYQVHYLVGEVQHTGTGTVAIVAQGLAGEPFYSMPCCPLMGQPDTDEDMIIEWYDPRTAEWIAQTLTFDGVKSAEYSEALCPDNGKWHLLFKNSTYFVVLPPLYWGLKMRITLTYVAGTQIVVATVPQGLGHPADYETFRTKMDYADFDLRGAMAEDIEALPWGMFQPGVYSVTVDTRAIMPPEVRFNSSGVLVDSARALTVEHLERTGTETVTSATVPAALEIDRANGYMKMDVSEWDHETTNDLSVIGDFLDMRNIPPAEILTGTQAAIRALKTFSVTPSGTGATYELVAKGAGGGIGALAWDANFTFTPLMPADPPYTPLWESIPPASGKIGIVLVGYAFIGRNAMHLTEMVGISGLAASEVESARIQVYVTGVTSFVEWHYRNNGGGDITGEATPLDPASAPLSVGCVIMDDDGSLRSAGYGGLGNLSVSGDDYQGMIDVTGIIQALLAAPPSPTEHVMFYLSGGIAAGDNASFEGYRNAWSSGDLSDVGDECTTRLLEFGSFGFGNLYITISHTGLEANCGHVFAGFMPPLVTP